MTLIIDYQIIINYLWAGLLASENVAVVYTSLFFLLTKRRRILLRISGLGA